MSNTRHLITLLSCFLICFAQNSTAASLQSDLEKYKEKAESIDATINQKNYEDIDPILYKLKTEKVGAYDTKTTVYQYLLGKRKLNEKITVYNEGYALLNHINKNYNDAEINTIIEKRDSMEANLGKSDIQYQLRAGNLGNVMQNQLVMLKDSSEIAIDVADILWNPFKKIKQIKAQLDPAIETYHTVNELFWILEEVEKLNQNNKDNGVDSKNLESTITGLIGVVEKYLKSEEFANNSKIGAAISTMGSLKETKAQITAISKVKKDILDSEEKERLLTSMQLKAVTNILELTEITTQALKIDKKVPVFYDALQVATDGIDAIEKNYSRTLFEQITVQDAFAGTLHSELDSLLENNIEGAELSIKKIDQIEMVVPPITGRENEATVKKPPSEKEKRIGKLDYIQGWSGEDQLVIEDNKESILLANDVYKLKEEAENPEGKIIIHTSGKYEIIDYTSLPSGFEAATFKNIETGKIIVSFAGTDDMQDVAEDLLNIPVTNSHSKQFIEAIEYIDRIANQNKHAADNDDIEITGHSLGGGLARYAGLRTGFKTTTVNAAPSHYRKRGSNT